MQNRPQQNKSEPKPPETPAEKPQHVKEHLRCPHCWGMLKGVGIKRWHYRASGTEIKYCYKCDKCGFDWITIRTLEVDPVQTRRI